jgi:hypothetical protein
MNAKLIVEGKEFEIEILDPELQKLIAPKKKTGYERVALGDLYSYESSAKGGKVCQLRDTDIDADRGYYEAANYYSDETVAENNARADKLMRQLRRFAAEHNKHPKQRNMVEVSKAWVIKYGINTGLHAKEVESTYFGDIYFDESAAWAAVEKFHDELIWYFTEYKDSL